MAQHVSRLDRRFDHYVTARLVAPGIARGAEHVATDFARVASGTADRSALVLVGPVRLDSRLGSRRQHAWTATDGGCLPGVPEAVVDQERWLTPGVRGIGTASLLADLGHEIPTSLLPSLLTSTLGAPASALGLIEGVSDGAAGIARFAGGALADDPHCRRATAAGYASTAVLTAATGAATAAWQVGLLRTAGWAARGLRVPARNALLADVVAPARYGAAYGFERMDDGQPGRDRWAVAGATPV